MGGYTMDQFQAILVYGYISIEIKHQLDKEIWYGEIAAHMFDMHLISRDI
jgi:hypothetical protein